MSNYKKQITAKLIEFGEDGTRLLLHVIRDMLTTTSTSLLNAWTELASLNFKDNGWDLIRMHSQCDSLVLTIVSGGQEIGDNLTKSQRVYTLCA